jgi:hypothetical protein
LQAQRDEPLLRTVVKIALQTPAGLVAGRDDPGPRRGKLRPGLGVGNRSRDEIGKVANPLFGICRQGLGPR